MMQGVWRLGCVHRRRANMRYVQCTVSIIMCVVCVIVCSVSCVYM